MINQKELAAWLAAHPVARLVLTRAAMLAVGGLIGLLAGVGLVPPEVAAGVQRGLGL